MTSIGIDDSDQKSIAIVLITCYLEVRGFIGILKTMKKKILISLLGVVVIIVLCLIALFFYFNQVENVTIQTGKYFDETGKELGTCKIERKLMKLADVSKATTYYFTPTGELVGYCKGDSIGSYSSSSGPAKPICSPENLQKLTDSKLYPYLSPGQAVTAKYRCVIDK